MVTSNGNNQFDRVNVAVGAEVSLNSFSFFRLSIANGLTLDGILILAGGPCGSNIRSEFDECDRDR